MSYKIYHKVWCDVPGCSVSPGLKGDAVPPQSVIPFFSQGQTRVPVIPVGWTYLTRAGLFVCPKHAVHITVDGDTPEGMKAAKQALRVLAK